MIGGGPDGGEGARRAVGIETFELGSRVVGGSSIPLAVGRIHDKMPNRKQ
jgi:hypothetical protein